MRFGACALLLGLAAVGCGRIERTRQCSNIVSTVNDAVAEIAERQDAGMNDSAIERQIATRYERLATDLAAIKLENPALSKAVSEYGEAARDTGRLLRRMADARDRRDPITIALSKRELSNQVRREKMIAVRIDGACQSP